MCGVAGFSGTIGNKYVRMALAEALGHGIDKRGGHASGWVCMTDGSVQTAKRLGSFQDAGMAWLLPLATSSAMMMHARWATHGSKEEVRNAHPFTVKRGEKTVLHGIHNGVLQNTEESARKHGRDHTVDSLEFFQLLADGNRDAIADIGGYGVVLWMKPRSNNIYICKLTAGADLVIEIDQMLDEATLGGKNRKCAVPDESSHIHPCPPHRSADHAVMLQHVHGAFDKWCDEFMVEYPGGPHLGTNARNAGIGESIV